MEKLLHERLRELKGATANEIREREQVIHSDELLDKWADEIERYYIPRPRFEDGEPVKRGDETAWGIVDGICVYSDGVWTLDDSSGTDIWGGTVDEFAKRPTPKVYDADGVPCKPDDRVWSISKEGVYEEGDTMIVVGIDAGVKERQVLVRRALGGAGEHWVNSKYLTHERPVFDAEDVRICKGDTVWFVRSKETRARTVDDIEPYDGEMCAVIGSLHYDPKNLTHKEPDSLEKLYADMRENSDNGKNDDPNTGFGFLTHDNHLDRFRALIDRGAK